MDKDKSS